MQKYAPIIFLLIGLALPDKAEAEDVIGGRPIIYVSHLTIEDQGDLQEPMLGLGIGMPFFFRNYRFCIEPELRLEVTVPFP
ncbi:MAG: hypothetical protein LBG90_08930, partial [Spirochaetaceae bacterium]|nr:hypothetical protein [Spirochaetaceae bacterium]